MEITGIAPEFSAENENDAAFIQETYEATSKYHVRDVERIKNLTKIEETAVRPAGFTSKNEALLLDSSTTKPTLGRYEIIKEVGQGAMGTVYLGKDPSINREVAIKTLTYAAIDLGELDEVKSQFFREAEAAGKLSHPNIVTIYDVGEDHDMAYIAMELLKGKDLTHYCKKEKLLPFKRVVHVIGSVAQALDYAHSKGIVHRDIKPANIMRIEETLEVKVTDFGIARITASSKTKTGISSASASTAFRASIIRDISPPEATFASGLVSSPGLREMKNSTASIPRLVTV